MVEVPFFANADEHPRRMQVDAAADGGETRGVHREVEPDALVVAVADDHPGGGIEFGGLGEVLGADVGGEKDSPVNGTTATVFRPMSDT
jgi:hypothetical protein